MISGAEGLAKTVAKHTGEDWQIYDGLKIFGLANEGDEKVLAGLREYLSGSGHHCYRRRHQPAAASA